MDLVCDSLMGGRRIRILKIADLWDRSSPALEVDMSLPGVRVVCVLEKLRLQGRLPQPIKIDNVLPIKSTHCVRQKYPVGAL